MQHHLTVHPAATSVVGTNSVAADFSVNGQSLTVSAAVTSGGAAVNEGTVTFTVLDGTSPVGSGSGTVSGGKASGRISLIGGLPEGTYPIEVSYTDPDGNYSSSTSAGRTLTLNPLPALALFRYQTGQWANSTVRPFGDGRDRRRFLFSTDLTTLPPGLPLAPGIGTVSGTPTTTGTFDFTVTVTDSVGGAEQSDLYDPRQQGPCAGSTLPDVTVGAAYRQVLALAGGTAPFAFSLLLVAGGSSPTPGTGMPAGTTTPFAALVGSGSLPPGLTLTPARAFSAARPPPQVRSPLPSRSPTRPTPLSADLYPQSMPPRQCRPCHLPRTPSIDLTTDDPAALDRHASHPPADRAGASPTATGDELRHQRRKPDHDHGSIANYSVRLAC